MAAPRAVSPQSPAIRLHRTGQIRSSATPTSLRVRQAGVGRCCSAYAQRGPSVGYSNGAARTSAIALRRRRHRSDRRIRIAPLRSSGFAVYLRGFQSSQSPTRHRMIARSRNADAASDKASAVRALVTISKNSTQHRPRHGCDRCRCNSHPRRGSFSNNLGAKLPVS